MDRRRLDPFPGVDPFDDLVADIVDGQLLGQHVQRRLVRCAGRMLGPMQDDVSPRTICGSADLAMAFSAAYLNDTIIADAVGTEWYRMIPIRQAMASAVKVVFHL